MSSRWSKFVGTLVLALAAAGAQATVLPPPAAVEGGLIAAGRGGVHDSFASFNLGRPGSAGFAKLLTDPRLLDITHDVLGDLIQIRPGPIGTHQPDGPRHRVPEPATWATLLAGLAALAWMTRRRPARAAAGR